MADEIDECELEHIGRDHRIAAGLFIPFAIERLRQNPADTFADLTVRLHDVGEPGERTRKLRLRWSPGSTAAKPLGVAAHTVTEWAALAVACAMLTRYTGFMVLRVAEFGDRFDYWIGDGAHEIGMEVSGTQGQDLGARQREKVAQLRSNPHGADGYVAVCEFNGRAAGFSFHRNAENNE